MKQLTQSTYNHFTTLYFSITVYLGSLQCYSVFTVLSRTLERHVVRSYIYPALQQPPPGLNFTDKFAFRPTGSTVAALIALIHTVLKKLSTNHYVHVFTLDFSKAFDTVRHAAVMEKLAQLTLPDPVYNWIADFFQGHSHCTKFAGEVSELADIFASVIQGSDLGPAAFLVTAADLYDLLTTAMNSVCQRHLFGRSSVKYTYMYRRTLTYRSLGIKEQPAAE